MPAPIQTEQIRLPPKPKSMAAYAGVGFFAATLTALAVTIGHFSPTNAEHAALKERVAILEVNQFTPQDREALLEVRFEVRRINAQLSKVHP